MLGSWLVYNRYYVGAKEQLLIILVTGLLGPGRLWENAVKCSRICTYKEHPICMSMSMSICLYAYIYVHVYFDVYVHMCMLLCIYIYIPLAEGILHISLCVYTPFEVLQVRLTFVGPLS